MKRNLLNLATGMAGIVLAATVASTPAQAFINLERLTNCQGGFLGCVADTVVPGSGEILDDAHDLLGNPLDEVWDGVRNGQHGGFTQSPPPAPAVFCSTPEFRFGPYQGYQIGTSCMVPWNGTNHYGTFTY